MVRSCWSCWLRAGVIALTVSSTAVAQAPVASTPPAHAAADVLRPGDTVRLRVWREPDLSGDFPVDETGAVVLPKLGRLSVSTESPQSLKAKLVGTYRELLSHSSVEVTVLRRISVVGAVRTPGLYPVDPTMTVGDALALAGGITPDGNQSKVELRRGGRTLLTTLSRGASIVDAQIRSGDELYIPQRAWISRNSGVFVSLVTAATSALVFALINR